MREKSIVISAGRSQLGCFSLTGICSCGWHEKKAWARNASLAVNSLLWYSLPVIHGHFIDKHVFSPVKFHFKNWFQVYFSGFCELKAKTSLWRFPKPAEKSVSWFCPTFSFMLNMRYTWAGSSWCKGSGAPLYVFYFLTVASKIFILWHLLYTLRSG